MGTLYEIDSPQACGLTVAIKQIQIQRKDISFCYGGVLPAGLPSSLGQSSAKHNEKRLMGGNDNAKSGLH